VILILADKLICLSGAGLCGNQSYRISVRYACWPRVVNGFQEATTTLQTEVVQAYLTLRSRDPNRNSDFNRSVKGAFDERRASQGRHQSKQGIVGER